MTSARALNTLDELAELFGDWHSRLCELEGQVDADLAAAVREASALLARADRVLVMAFVEAGGVESETSDAAGNVVE